MNFNVDDPLADLLSDNSLDNDNFFDNPAGASSTIKKSGKPLKAKSKLEDLFGIKEESETDAHVKTSSNLTPPSATSKPTATSTPRIVKQKPSLQQDDDDDDLGFDPKKPKGGVKLNLFDDLLSNMENTKRPTTAAAGTHRKDDVQHKTTMSRQSTDTTTENSNLLSQARPKTSSGRRSSAQSTVVSTDPLGLFGREKETNATVSGMSTPVSKKRGTTADWLGLGADPQPLEPAITTQQRQIERPVTPKSPPPAIVKPVTPTNKDNVNILHLPDADEGNVEQEVLETNIMPTFNPEHHAKKPLPGSKTAQNILLLNTLNLESNNTYATLQQQESQLVLATQMKNQERALLEMQRKQDSLLQQQERQFQALLQQQLQRQQQMEDHIKLQQQRINTHIHLMMTQPAMIATPMPAPLAQTQQQTSTGANRELDLTTTLVPEEVTLKPRSDEGVDEQTSATLTSHVHLIHIENELKRAELEKQRLEELIANMKVNYEQEIEMIEQSYKKQLKVLEEHLAAVEERLRAENNEMKQYYIKKLETLEQDIQKLKTDFETDTATLKQDHEDEIRKLRRSHDNDLNMLKEEHRRMLETIRESKMLEFAVVQDGGTYLETLRSASNNLEQLSGGLQGLRDDMYVKIETEHKEREKKLAAREAKLEDAERHCKINEEVAEQEKNRLMELVTSLELQLSKLSKDSAEENWQLRQRMCALEAEKHSFDREKEFYREQLARDEKRVADLKTQQLAETDRIMLELQEERERIITERSKIEIERKLHCQTDMDKKRLEVEAQLKVAHDSIRRADEERERYHKMQRQLEKDKREIIDREHRLSAKEEELEMERSAFRMAEARTQVALQKARQAEDLLQTKVQLVQKQMRQLSERESQMSQERMLLAQDRITLHNLKLKLSQSKCSLCQMTADNDELAHLLRKTASEVTNSTMANITAAPSLNLLAVAPQMDIVDRMLDENIAASFRKMQKSTNSPRTLEFWTESRLDDDSKKMAIENELENSEH